MPMQRDLYPPDWKAIAERHKEAANWTCEQCGAQRGDQRPNRHGELKPVVITTAHVNHDPWARNAQLKVLCASCHLRYDAKQRRRQRRMMAMARGQMVLPHMQRWYRGPARGT